MDFRKQYTKHIKENVYNFAVAGDIDQENPVNPDNAKEIQDLLRKKGVSANVSPSETKYNEVVVKSSFTKSYIKSLLDRAGILESLFEGFVPLVPSNMRYMNRKKAQDAIDKVIDRAGNIRFVKHFENDTVGLVRFIYGENELKKFDFQFPGIYYRNKRVTFHDLILKAREKVDGAKKILGLGKYKKEEKEVPVAPTEGIKKEKNMKEAFPKPKEDKDKKIKDLENKVQKLEVEKESELNPEPNPDTGEIPLQVGVAYKYIRDKAKGIVDKEEKKKEKKEVKVGKKTLTNKRKEKIDVEPEMEV